MEKQIFLKQTFSVPDAMLDFNDSEKKTYRFLTSWSLYSNDGIPLFKICQGFPFDNGLQGNFIILSTTEYELSDFF